MFKVLRLVLLFAILAPLPVSMAAQDSVNRADGLAAWERVYEVTSHPRCANCHVGPSDRPMWSGSSYGKVRPHGMNIQAGDSRIGAETIPCQTCHTVSDRGNPAPHAAPRVDTAWMLAPPEAHWFGQPSEVICNQLRDPERNGGRTPEELAEHLGHDIILHWAWSPGGTREAAPYSLAEHISDLEIWGEAGTPCPDD
ncbi:hypothetical protein G5B38_03120 [Pseudohalocynthiibacter aestuariivivens]|nr:hypothetical protein [Pseudohalocynthiibacter aestuariivivens]QIE44601.1 hypothetical protein G5B38_03120 [Pseudohalocynthiibacter aestuariivivens]